MNDEERDPESKQNSLDLMGRVTGRIGKVRALIVALVTLLVAIGYFFDIGSNLIARFETEESAKDCFKANMNYPETVSVSKWSSMRLSLTSRNRCREKLGVHLAFKTKNLAKVAFESPVSDCRDLVDPNCWEERFIEIGEVNEEFKPPDLKVLKRPLGEPVDIYINWVVYNVETRMQLHSGAAQIQLTDDP